MGSQEDAEKVISQLNGIQKRVRVKRWEKHLNPMMWRVLKQESEELGKVGESVKGIIGKEPEIARELGIRNYIVQLAYLKRLLRRNSDYERKKAEIRAEKPMLGNAEVPEIYADLEQKLLDFVMQLRFAMERLNVRIKRKEAY